MLGWCFRPWCFTGQRCWWEMLVGWNMLSHIGSCWVMLSLQLLGLDVNRKVAQWGAWDDAQRMGAAKHRHRGHWASKRWAGSKSGRSGSLQTTCHPFYFSKQFADTSLQGCGNDIPLHVQMGIYSACFWVVCGNSKSQCLTQSRGKLDSFAKPNESFFQRLFSKTFAFEDFWLWNMIYDCDSPRRAEWQAVSSQQLQLNVWTSLFSFAPCCLDIFWLYLARICSNILEFQLSTDAYKRHLEAVRSAVSSFKPALPSLNSSVTTLASHQHIPSPTRFRWCSVDYPEYVVAECNVSLLLYGKPNKYK